MELEIIMKYASFGLTILNLFVILFYLIRKRGKAQTEEEKNQIDEVIMGTLTVALANIKTNLANMGLQYDGGKTIKTMQKIVKEEKHAQKNQIS